MIPWWHSFHFGHKSQVPLLCNLMSHNVLQYSCRTSTLMSHNIAYCLAVTQTEYKSEFEFPKRHLIFCQHRLYFMKSQKTPQKENWWMLSHWGRDKMAAIFQRTFSNAFSWMKMYEFRLINIPVKFVPKCPINNIPSLFQIMAWRRPGAEPLSETMMVTLLTHICVTRPQWVITEMQCICHNRC